MLQKGLNVGFAPAGAKRLEPFLRGQLAADSTKLLGEALHTPPQLHGFGIVLRFSQRIVRQDRPEPVVAQWRTQNGLPEGFPLIDLVAQRFAFGIGQGMQYSGKEVIRAVKLMIVCIARLIQTLFVLDQHLADGGVSRADTVIQRACRGTVAHLDTHVCRPARQRLKRSQNQALSVRVLQFIVKQPLISAVQPHLQQRRPSLMFEMQRYALALGHHRQFLWRGLCQQLPGDTGRQLRECVLKPDHVSVGLDLCVLVE
ncbi:hypothetical protein D3C76_502490 [compost metagenome]